MRARSGREKCTTLHHSASVGTELEVSALGKAALLVWLIDSAERRATQGAPLRTRSDSREDRQDVHAPRDPPRVGSPAPGRARGEEPAPGQRAGEGPREAAAPPRAACTEDRFGALSTAPRLPRVCVSLAGGGKPPAGFAAGLPAASLGARRCGERTAIASHHTR